MPIDYTYMLHWNVNKAEYLIVKFDPARGINYGAIEKDIVWRRDYDADEDLGEYTMPEDLRKEYERLTGKKEFSDQPGEEPFNMVELVAAGEDGGHDQQCVWGNRVEYHALYCHNSYWLYAPRKCRRGKWGSAPMATCPGFKLNPNWDGKR